MTAHSVDRQHRRAMFVAGLYRAAGWLENDATVPTPEHLPIIVPADTPAHVADIAIGHDLEGPLTADDGSVFIYRGFGGGVTYQVVAFNNPDRAGNSERHARAWADANGYILVPRINPAGGPS